MLSSPASTALKRVDVGPDGLVEDDELSPILLERDRLHGPRVGMQGHTANVVDGILGNHFNGSAGHVDPDQPPGVDTDRAHREQAAAAGVKRHA